MSIAVCAIRAELSSCDGDHMTFKAKIFPIPSNQSRGSEKREEFTVIWSGPMVEVPFLWTWVSGEEARRSLRISRLMWAQGKQIHPEKDGRL